MFDRLLDFLSGRAEPTTDGPKAELEAAVAALLVEAARKDDDFDARERATIEELLSKNFQLTPEEARKAIAAAEYAVADTTQYFRFTHRINQSLSEAEKSKVIEMLWRVAYADGVLDPYEDALIRQVAGLIYVTDRERAFARQRALEGLGKTDDA